jgi:protein-tyrosine phosphatase
MITVHTSLSTPIFNNTWQYTKWSGKTNLDNEHKLYFSQTRETNIMTMPTRLEITENIIRFVTSTPMLSGFIVPVPDENVESDDVVRLHPVASVNESIQREPVLVGTLKQKLLKSANTKKEKLYLDILFQTAEDSRLAHCDTSGNIVFEGIKITPEIVEKYLAVKNASITAKVVTVRDGLLCIGHRPKHSDLFDLRDEGFTHVVTVQSKSEEARDIGHETEKIGLRWIWLPLGTAKVPVKDEEDIRHIKTVLRQLVSLFNHSEPIAKTYLHCSAGLHRTGMITFALLRLLGYSQAETMDILTRLRELTAQNVGAERIAWAESFCETV